MQTVSSWFLTLVCSQQYQPTDSDRIDICEPKIFHVCHSDDAMPGLRRPRDLCNLETVKYSRTKPTSGLSTFSYDFFLEPDFFPLAAARILFSLSICSVLACSCSALSSASAFLRSASASRLSLTSLSRSRSARASSVLPSACSFWYRSFACCACRASRSRRLSASSGLPLAVFEVEGAATGAAAAAVAARTDAAAFLLWFGLAGGSSSESSSSELGGRSPGSGRPPFLAMAAALRALAASRRCSRVSSSLGSSSESESSSSSSSSDEVSSSLDSSDTFLGRTCEGL